jgi:general secretion pathway protein M
MSRLAQLRQSVWARRAAAHWQALSSREQGGLKLLGALLALALVWAVLLAPAQRALSHSASQREQLAREQGRLLALQAQAQALQQQQRAVTAPALPTVQRLTQERGWPLQVQGARVTVQLKAATATALAAWLAQLREQAHALPLEVHLQRNTSQSWDGTVVLRLPEAVAP